MNKYIVIGQHSWNFELFKDYLRHLPGKWFYVRDMHDCEELAKEINPRYIFFVHWSHIVPDWFTAQYECVCFHPTDLPYGRGGTPIQNLILEGKKETKITAFRMTNELDAGPVYIKRNLSLHGNLRQIFNREMSTVGYMIRDITEQELFPVPQEGEVTYFKRRNPDDSEIDPSMTLEELYDHIRMLDADGYPLAKITMDKVVIEISNAQPMNGGMFVEAFIKSHD